MECSGHIGFCDDEEEAEINLPSPGKLKTKPFLGCFSCYVALSGMLGMKDKFVLTLNPLFYNIIKDVLRVCSLNNEERGH